MYLSWSVEHMKALKIAHGNILPLNSSDENRRALPESFLWDFWPVLSTTGGVAQVEGAELWMSLSAPSTVAPGDRHHVARIRLLARRDGILKDCGLLLPEGFSLGSHEWTGSALLDTASGILQLYYTAVGRSDRPGPSYQQRLAQAQGNLWVNADGIGFSGWEHHREAVVADGEWYAVADQQEGEPGFIRAFRDPAVFFDPADGCKYLVFTASLGQPKTAYSGAVGLAKAVAGGDFDWQLCPPLLGADGVNNELERAHVVFNKGLYYLFWSTQSRTFHSDCPGPTGLYGAVSEKLTGDYKPLNGSGLVLTNPPESPGQCYAWQVLDDLRVVSFIDSVGSGIRAGEASGVAEEKFVGSMAPMVSLRLEGDRAFLVEKN
jgi:levansucrase